MAGLSVSGTATPVLLIAGSPFLFDLSPRSNLSTRVRVLPGTTATAKMEIFKDQNTSSFVSYKTHRYTQRANLH